MIEIKHIYITESIEYNREGFWNLSVPGDAYVLMEVKCTKHSLRSWGSGNQYETGLIAIF